MYQINSLRILEQFIKSKSEIYKIMIIFNRPSSAVRTINYIDIIPHGCIRIFERNFKLISEFNFNNGLRHGLKKMYYRNNLTYEFTFKNGELHGIYKQYHENKNTHTFLFINGKKFYSYYE